LHTSTSFCHRNHFFVFRKEHSQSTTLGPKLMFDVVSRNFLVACLPFRKRVSGCIQNTNFCHRINFFVFCNGHAQSTTLGPKHMFGVISRNFVVARHPFRKRVSRCIQARVFANGTISSFFATNISQRTCPIHYFKSKTHVWGGFAQFRCNTSPILKTGVEVPTSTRFCHRNHFFVFCNEHAQSTNLGAKLMFGVVSRNFVAARHPLRKWVSGCIQSKSFLPPDQFLRFLQRTCPIHNFRSKTHVWGGFAQFRCRTSPIPKTGVGGAYKHEFLPPDQFLRFLQRTCPIHNFRSKTHVWGGFAQFRCRTSPIPKTGVGGAYKHEFFCHWNHFFIFHNEHAQSTTLGPKLMFGLVSRNFVAARHPFRKRVSGCIQSMSFCHRNHFFVFRNKHAQSTTLGPKLMFGLVSRNFVVARHPF
jgi:RNA polymerase subunit RPABC4/transcription elongation factor Spt4